MPVAGQDDEELYRQLLEAMNIMGFSKEEQLGQCCSTNSTLMVVCYLAVTSLISSVNLLSVEPGSGYLTEPSRLARPGLPFVVRQHEYWQWLWLPPIWNKWRVLRNSIEPVTRTAGILAVNRASHPADLGCMLALLSLTLVGSQFYVANIINKVSATLLQSYCVYAML